MNRHATKWFVMIAILITAGAVGALSHAAEASLNLSEAWIRPTLGAGRTTAAYLTITNTGGHGDRLIAVEVPNAGAVETHTAGMTDGIMRMRHVEGIDIPAGETIQLAPGGLHIMVMSLEEPIAKGGEVPLTLVFEDAGSMTIMATVTLTPPATPSPHMDRPDMDHTGMDHSGMNHDTNDQSNGMSMPDDMHHGH